MACRRHLPDDHLRGVAAMSDGNFFLAIFALLVFWLGLFSYALVAT